MHNHHIKFAFILITILGLVGLGSCRKSERDSDSELLAVQENAIAYHVFDDAFREVHRFAMRDSLLNDTGIKQRFNSCMKKATLSDTVAVFPLYLTLNYRDEGQICDDGFQRYGKLMASFSGKYLNKFTTIVITFEDYVKDEFSVSGTMTYQNLGLNSDGHMRYSWTVEDGLITSVNTNFSWSGTHTLVWVAGRSEDSQGIVDDDVFLIDGFAEGRSTRGNTFSNEINGNYTSDLGCQWFTSGRSILEIPNLIPRTINYGVSTECDNILIARRNDTYYEVRIPY